MAAILIILKMASLQKQLSTYKMNILDGLTQKWDSTGLLTDSVIYENGKLANKTQLEYSFSNAVSRRIFTDSINNTLKDVFYDPSGKKSSEVLFVGDKGVWKYYFTGCLQRTESLTTRKMK
jgi:antitoxin component YwqK of YwqJK toxin-antitoxin module